MAASHPAGFSARSRWNAVLGAGILFALACPPYEQAWAAWLVPGLLLVATRRFTPGKAFAAGLLYAVVIGATVGNWLPYATAELLGLSTLQARPLVYALYLINPGIPCALLLAAYAFAAPRIGAVDRPILGAFLWVASEWMRNLSLGWELLGHTQYREMWLIQVADLGGTFAVSFVVALISIALAELIAERAWEKLSLASLAGRLVTPAAVLLVTVAYGIGAGRIYAPANSAAVSAQAPAEGDERAVSSAQPTGPSAGMVRVAYERPQLHLRQVSSISASGAGEMMVSPILCLDVLDTALVHGLVRDGAEVLINNCRVPWMDALGADAPAQHLAMAVLRAVETRRFLVRSSAGDEAQMVSPFGTTYGAPPQGTALTLRDGMTRYVAMGDAWILVGLGISIATTLRGRKQTSAA